mmetsp:Transcript_50946/g.119036  ORF Transcript_50946/g.119036 Transcript_50946/m.119036 type:complete len:1487 (+) Transcript_50946:3-4463(+)
MHSLRGYVETAHGQVRLVLPELLNAHARRPKRGDYMSEDEDDNRPMVCLEICRAQTQPFRLEFARPRPEQIRMMHRARSDTNIFDVALLMSSDSSGQRSDLRHDAGSQRFLNKFWKFSDRSMSNLGSAMTQEASHGKSLHEKSYPSRPPRPSIGSASGVAAAAGMFQKFGSQHALEAPVKEVVGSDDRVSDDGAAAPPHPHTRRMQSRTASLGSEGMEKAQAPTLPRGARRNRGNLHFPFLSPFHARRHAPNRYNFNAWHPTIGTDWVHLWKGPWPVESEDLAGKHEVHPLMEAEFRKDCIVFFNTLFPRVKGENFMMLKAAALNVTSPIAFKCCFRPMRQGSVGSIFGLQRRYSFATAKSSIADMDRNFATSPFTPYWKGVSSSNCSSDSQSQSAEATEVDTKDVELNEEVDNLDVPAENAVGEIPETKEKADEELHFDQLATLATAPCLEGDESKQCGDLTLEHAWSMSGSNVNSEKIEPEVEDSSMAILSEPLVSTTPSRTRWNRSHTENKYYDTSRSTPASGRTPQAGGRLRERRQSLLSQASLFGGGVMGSLNSTHSGQYVAPKLVMADKTQFADEYSPRILFLKRLMICFATCGVHYREDNRKESHLWPYPIASILGHGARVLIRLEEVTCYEFLNFLLAGDPKIVDWFESGIPQPLSRRMAATHAVTPDPITNELVERKLEVTNAMDTIVNIMDGALGRHLGMNLPIGGAANPSPLGKGALVGFTGDVVKPESSDLLLSFVEKVAKLTKKKLGIKSKHSDDEEQDMSDDLRNCLGGLTDSTSKDLTLFTEAKKANAAIRRKQRWRRARQLFTEWKAVPNVQGGHLYVRIDDHGEMVVNKDEVDAGSTIDNAKKELRRRNHVEQYVSQGDRKMIVLHGHLQRRRTVRTYKPELAGLLMLPGEEDDFAERHRQKVQFAVEPGHACTWSHDGPVRLQRMMSDPCLPKYPSDSTVEDIQWVQHRVWEATPAPLKDPPSANAVRLLLEYFDPDSVRLFGTGSFGSIQDLYQELTAKKDASSTKPRCALIKRGAGVLRLVEPMYIRIRYETPTGLSYVLVPWQPTPDEAHEVQPQVWSSRRLPFTRVAAQNIRGEELWQIPFEDWWAGSFEMPYSTFSELVVSDGEKHRILQERGFSLRYPGLDCLCRSHFVSVRVRADSCSEFRKYRFQFPEEIETHEKSFPLTNPKSEAEEEIVWQWVLEDEVDDWPQVGDPLPPHFADATWLRTAENDMPHCRSQRSYVPSLAPSEGVLSVEESRTFDKSTTPLSISTSHALGRTDSKAENAHSPTASTTSPKSSRKLQPLGKPKAFLKGRRGSIGAPPTMSDPNRKPIHSVLLGLEGSMPGKQSPFNTKHDASGKSSAISAVGSRKWRAYKMNSALQVPSEIGGITMKINKAMFADLQETCDKLDLVDPRVELLLGREEGFSREMLARRFLEKELFQNILSGSGLEARAAVDWMLNYRATTRTTDQAWKSMLAKPPRASKE